MQNHYYNNTLPLHPYTHSSPATPGTAAPVNALRGEAPVMQKGFWPCEKDGTWLQVEDHRERDGSSGFALELQQEGTPYWLPGDAYGAEARKMKDIGPLPGGAILTAPEQTPEETQATMLAAFTAAIQAHLDSFAQSRSYDGIMSAATYATSTVPKFAVEGQYAVEARDATWATAYAILDDVLSGIRSMPTMEEVIAELPLLEWPL